MRIFRVPEFLATAFLLAVIGMLVHLLLGDRVKPPRSLRSLPPEGALSALRAAGRALP